MRAFDRWRVVGTGLLLGLVVRPAWAQPAPSGPPSAAPTPAPVSTDFIPLAPPPQGPAGAGPAGAGAAVADPTSNGASTWPRTPLEAPPLGFASGASAPPGAPASPATPAAEDTGPPAGYFRDANGRLMQVEFDMNRRFWLGGGWAPVFAQHGGRKGAKTLAELDPQIERALHGRRTRIADDRACAERARAEFHLALEPADRLFRHQRFDSILNQHVVIERRKHRAGLAQTLFDFALRE